MADEQQPPTIDHLENVRQQIATYHSHAAPAIVEELHGDLCKGGGQAIGGAHALLDAAAHELELGGGDELVSHQLTDAKMSLASLEQSYLSKCPAPETTQPVLEGEGDVE